MAQTRAITDSGVQRAGAGSGRSGPAVESMSALLDLPKLGFAVSADALNIWKRCGFQRVLFMFEADQSKQIRSINAVIDIYYLGDSSTGEEALKIGRVSYAGKLVPGPTPQSPPEWSVSMAPFCQYNRSNGGQLPSLVQQVGPGAFITFVIQTMFGTSYGQELLGLEDYTIPKHR